MKAITYETYGGPDVLKLQDIDRPTVGDDEVLVRVRAAGLNPSDWHVMRGKPYIMRLMMGGVLSPTGGGFGADFAGEVEAVGKNVTKFRPGDAVFGELPMTHSSFAESVCVTEDGVAAKPANLTYEQAAAVPMAAFTALQGLRDQGRIQPGYKVLINGASGGVGTFGVQIAKVFGGEVTGVCSTKNVDMVRALGAERVIDYTHEDFTQNVERYDLMFDTVGNRALSDCRRVLKPEGVYVSITGSKGNWIGPLIWFAKHALASRLGSQKMMAFVAQNDHADLLELKALLEVEKITPVIDRLYPLCETAEAIRYLERGHARGKVVITV